MARRVLTSGAVALLAIGAAVVTTVTPATTTPAVAQTTATCNGYPCLGSFQELAAWSPPSSDPRQIARVPLAPRVAHAAPDMVLGIDTSGWDYAASGDGATQGGSVGNLYSFTRWQYVDVAYYYHHGLISIPPVVWTNAAHRNGVPILGAVTADFDPCDHETPPSGALMNELFAPENVATTQQQLVAMAHTYGFDGWILDFECGANITDEVVSTLAALKADGLVSMVYQAFKPSLSTANPPLLAAANAATGWQSDYPIGPTTAQDTYNTLTSQSGGLQPFRAYSAENLYAADHNLTPPCASGQLSNTIHCLNIAEFLGDLQFVQNASAPNGAWTSFGVYAPAWAAYGGSQGIGDVIPPVETWRAVDQTIWEGATPSGPDCSTASSGAVSQFVPARSTITSLPFVTDFNRGIGTGYAVQGVAVAPTDWNHFGTTDVLPQWFCRVAGSDAEATLAYGDGGWEGGTALAVKGQISPSANEEWALWNAAAPMTDPVVRLRYRGDGPVPAVRLAFSDGSSASVPAVGATSRGWTTSEVHVANSAGKTFVRVGVSVSNSGAAAQAVDLTIGELAIVESNQLAQPALLKPATGSVLWYTLGAAEVRGNVWAVDGARQCLAFLGPTFSDSYDATHPLFPGNVPSQVTGYRVQPVSAAGVAASLDLPTCASSTAPGGPAPSAPEGDGPGTAGQNGTGGQNAPGENRPPDNNTPLVPRFTG